MGRSGAAQAFLDNHMPDWTMLDTGLYYGFYQLRYVPRSLMPFDCFCGAAQSIMSLMVICLYDVCPPMYSPNNMSFSKLFALAHAALLKSGRFVSGSMILP
jgi:hypothetical protein